MLLGPGQLVGKLVGVLRLMVASNRDTHDAYELPTRLLSRLILGHEVFGRQFVEAGGLRDGILPRLLGGENPPGLLIDALLLVSQLARSNKEYYAHVDGADIYPHIKVRSCCHAFSAISTSFGIFNIQSISRHGGSEMTNCWYGERTRCWSRRRRSCLRTRSPLFVPRSAISWATSAVTPRIAIRLCCATTFYQGF